MEKLLSIAEVTRYVDDKKRRALTVAFVPTMGALHDGHRSCVEIGGENGDIVLASIFVNPTQFGPGEDLERYPRPVDDDVRKCEEWGCDAVFIPPAAEMYPSEQEVWVEVERYSAPLCGRTRIGHFRGVATVVMKLFNIVRPDVAVFGQKDAQQAIVIREMVRQLNMPVTILLSPIIREEDGLAMSSRNAYFSPNDRKLAAGIYKSLCVGRDIVVAGERDPARVTEAVRGALREARLVDIEYVELLRADDLSPLGRIEGTVLLAAAARVGPARLIDNIVLSVGKGGEVEDAMLF